MEMAKKLIGLLTALIVLLTVAGCSAINSGRVTGKEYETSYTYSTMQCASFGKYGCTVYVPIFHTEPEHYRLDLKNADKTGWVYVSKQTYDDIHIGDVYTAQRE